MEEKRKKIHQISLVNRERLLIEGVLAVDSFDDREILVETELGGLLIEGQDLHIKELNLETANLTVQGHLRSLEYTGDSLGKKGKGFWVRLFR